MAAIGRKNHAGFIRIDRACRGIEFAREEIIKGGKGFRWILELGDVEIELLNKPANLLF